MKLAMLFPGQGSQAVGMLKGYEGLPELAAVRAEAAAVLGSDFVRLLDEGPAENLNQTVNTQPAMVTAGYAAYRAWRALGGVQPAVLAGHSLGEYTALVAAGAIAFRDCLPLVRFRAQSMQEAVPEGKGAMAAILMLEDAKVVEACAEAGGEVQAVNFNAPGQVVIAGSPDGVASAGVHAKELGAKKVISLPVSGAFHTPFMTPARDRLRKAIAQASPRDTEVPIVSNVDARAHHTGAEWSSLLSAQLSSPVRWKHCLLTMAGAGVDSFAELGPGGVLTGMAKRTVATARTFSAAVPDDLDQLLEFVSGRTPTKHTLVGEHLFATERIVVSPAAGVFAPAPDISPGQVIEVGTVVGHVGSEEVRSPFTGVVQAYIAVDGERVQSRQPIAWLRTV
jgi:[acyl-carrier-protein] S-malonyltransferase